MNCVPNFANQLAQVQASRDATYPDMLRCLIREHCIGWLLQAVVGLTAELRCHGNKSEYAAAA